MECNHYESIMDMPVYKWDNYLLSGDYRWFFKEFNKESDMLYLEGVELRDVAENITNQIIDEFGLSPGVIQKIKLQINILYYELTILSGQKHNKTRLDYERKRLNDLIESEQKTRQKIGKKAAFLTKHYKFPVNVKTMSIYDFYYLLNIYNEEINEQNLRTNGKTNKK